MQKLLLLFTALTSIALAQAAPCPNGSNSQPAAHCTPMTWGASSSASQSGVVTGYNIYESTSANATALTGTPVKIGSVGPTTLTYTDMGTALSPVSGQVALVPGTTLYYAITAFGPGGESSQSVPSNASVTPFPIPAPPPGVSVSPQ